ncbi:hypothetical protein Tco_1127543 [Tanacetum coccineum]
MGQNGSNCFVRLGLRSRGFKASILHLISILGDSWDFLDQRFAAINNYRRRGVGVIERRGVRGFNEVLCPLVQPWVAMEQKGRMWSFSNHEGTLIFRRGACKKLGMEGA